MDQAKPRSRLAPWQVRRVTAYIDANLANPMFNDDLAGVARLSRAHFCRAFRTSVGSSPREYIIRRRLEHAQALMLSTKNSLSQIAADCGLFDQSHLARLFRRLFNESPTSWRRQNAGAHVIRETQAAASAATNLRDLTETCSGVSPGV